MASEEFLGRPADPLGERLQRGAEEDIPGPTLVGFLGSADGTEYRQLYLVTGGHVEFRADDVVAWASIPPEESPVVGEPATAVQLKPDARVNFILEEVTDNFELTLRVHDTLANDLVASGKVAFDAVTGVSYFATKRTNCQH